MAISVVGTATSTFSPGTASTYTINVPTGVANGDLLLLTEALQSASGTNNSAPSGWLVWRTATTVAAAASIGQSNWYRWASSEPGSYTFSSLQSARYGVVMRAYRGVDPTTPSDATVTQATSSSTYATEPAIVSVTNGAMIDAVHSVQAASGVTNTTFSSSNLTSSSYTTSTNAGTANAAIGYGYFLQSSAGSFTFDLTPSGTPVKGIATASALRPATVAADYIGWGVPL